ncbi:unnamed protein product, partial [Mesorhabditis spiculigera]
MSSSCCLLRLLIVAVLLTIAYCTLQCTSDETCPDGMGCFEGACQRVYRMQKRDGVRTARSAQLYCESDDECLQRQDYRNKCYRNQCSPLWLNRLRMG